MNAELLLELLEEYTADMRRRNVEWLKRQTLAEAHNIILEDQQEQARP